MRGRSQRQRTQGWRRLAILALATPACTFSNEFDATLLDPPPTPTEACTGGDDEDEDGLVDCFDPDCRDVAPCADGEAGRCADGIDNDGDGLQDCADDECWWEFECWPGSRLTEGEPCEPARPSFVMADRFDEIEEVTWRTMSAAPQIAPFVHDGALYPNGSAFIGAAGLVSRDRFTVGSEQHFQLIVAVREVGDCASADAGCALFIELNPVDVAEHGLFAGEPVAGVALGPTGERGRWKVSCFYLGNVLGGGEIVAERALSQALRIEIDPDTGRVGWLLGLDATEPFCEGPELPSVSPELHLVLVGLRHPDADSRPAGPAVVVEGMTLEVRAQHRRGRCEALRTPLFRDIACIHPRGLPDNGDPRVVRLSDEGPYLMLHSSGRPGAAQYAGLARSDDGRLDWDHVGTQAHLELGSIIDRLGALVVSPDGESLWAWARMIDNDDGSLLPPRLFAAPLEDPQRWEVVGELVYDRNGEVDADSVWVPKTVLIDDDGRLSGWHSGMGQEGRPGIFRSVSEDGIHWSLVGLEPELGPGEGEAWDAGGVDGPSVTRVGDLFVMAYTGKRTVEPRAIGLAISEDGENWVRHRGNPVVTGATEFFDEAGVHHPSLLVENDTIRIWYQGHSLVPRRCPVRPEVEAGDRNEVGLTELVFDRSAPALLSKPNPTR